MEGEPNRLLSPGAACFDSLFMSTAKTKPKAKGTSESNYSDEKFSHEKAAVRSEAFAKAILDARSYSEDPARLRVLLKEAAKKAATLPKEPFRDTWPYLQTMLRLIRAYEQGDY